MDVVATATPEPSACPSSSVMGAVASPPRYLQSTVKSRLSATTPSNKPPTISGSNSVSTASGPPGATTSTSGGMTGPRPLCAPSSVNPKRSAKDSPRISNPLKGAADTGAAKPGSKVGSNDKFASSVRATRPEGRDQPVSSVRPSSAPARPRAPASAASSSSSANRAKPAAKPTAPTTTTFIHGNTVRVVRNAPSSSTASVTAAKKGASQAPTTAQSDNGSPVESSDSVAQRHSRQRGLLSQYQRLMSEKVTTTGGSSTEGVGSVLAAAGDNPPRLLRFDSTVSDDQGSPIKPQNSTSISRFVTATASEADGMNTTLSFTYSLSNQGSFAGFGNNTGSVSISTDIPATSSGQFSMDTSRLLSGQPSGSSVLSEESPNKGFEVSTSVSRGSVREIAPHDVSPTQWDSKGCMGLMGLMGITGILGSDASLCVIPAAITAGGSTPSHMRSESNDASAEAVLPVMAKSPAKAVSPRIPIHILTEPTADPSCISKPSTLNLKDLIRHSVHDSVSQILSNEQWRTCFNGLSGDRFSELDSRMRQLEVRADELKSRLGT